MEARLLLVTITGLLSTPTTGTDLDSDPQYEKLSWFVHITDIHISDWEDLSRQSQLRTFVRDHLALIQPEFVMCGGDLTDAKDGNDLISKGQIITEWEKYRNITDERWNNLPWMDIRGNHDNLNVLSRASKMNYFSNYSVMGREGNLNSYSKRFKSRNQTFNVVAVDATFELGMNYPFNFVGYLNDNNQKILNEIVNDIKKDEIPIFFGHYPTSVINQGEYIRTLISHSLVYLSGHLHDLAFFKMYNMYTLHNDKHLELELVDWKNNRRFRILAVDDGKLSFVDVKFEDWPIALVTYPKDMNYMMDGKEDYTDYHRNTIRVLVFNKTNIVRVLISVDGEEALEAGRQGAGPLYLLPWDSHKYSEGVHDITVTVISEGAPVKTVKHQFTLKASEAKLLNNGLPNFVLRSSFTVLFQTLYFLTLALNVFLAVSLKVVYYLAQSGRLSVRQRQIFTKCCQFSLFRKLVLVTSCNVIFYSMLAYVVYMAVGPWVVGSLVEGHRGALFAWGVLINKQLVEVQIPFAYYWLHCGLVHPVMVFVIGQILDYRNGLVSCLGNVFISGLLILMAIFCIVTSVTFWLQFGILGFILGPLKTWSYVFYCAMMVLAWRTGEQQLSEGYRRVVISNNRIKKNDDENPDDVNSSMLSI